MEFGRAVCLSVWSVDVSVCYVYASRIIKIHIMP